MTILETNIILLKKVPEELQTEIQSFIMSKIDMTKNIKPIDDGIDIAELMPCYTEEEYKEAEREISALCS